MLHVDDVGIGVQMGAHERSDGRHRRRRRRFLWRARLRRQAAAAALQAVGAYHLFDHADRETFLESAELAAVAASLVNRTVLVAVRVIARQTRQLSTMTVAYLKQMYLAPFCTVRLKKPLQPSQVLTP